MADPDPHKKLSKLLACVLRHQPGSIGIELDAAGWVPVDELLRQLAARKGRRVTRAKLDEAVATNPKRRFEFDADRRRVRATQGHSVEVDLELPPTRPPETLFHGTAARSLESILREGLTRQKRRHVHLSTDRALMLSVAARHGRPVLLAVRAAELHEAGHAFLHTSNDVWLTDAVPATHLRVVDPEAVAS